MEANELLPLNTDKIIDAEVEERFPGVYRLRLYFANGRGASIIDGPALGLMPGRFEIAPLSSDGVCVPDALGWPDVRRGAKADIAQWVTEIADLPAEGTEVTA